RHENRVADGVPVQDVDGLPLDVGARLRRPPARPIPADDTRVARREEIEQVAAGKPGRAGDENQRGTPLIAPLNGEKLPMPARVNERKKRRSAAIGTLDPTP